MKLRGKAKRDFLARMARGRRKAAGRGERSTGSRGSKRSRPRAASAQLATALAAIADGKAVAGVSTSAPSSSSGPVLLPSQANPVMKRALPFGLRSTAMGTFGRSLF